MDVALQNGSPYLFAQGLSFEGPRNEEREYHAQLTAWAFRDLKDRYNVEDSVVYAVMMLKPKTSSKTYNENRETFERLGAAIVNEDQLKNWSEEQAERIRDKTLSLLK